MVSGGDGGGCGGRFGGTGGGRGRVGSGFKIFFRNCKIAVAFFNIFLKLFLRPLTAVARVFFWRLQIL